MTHTVLIVDNQAFNVDLAKMILKKGGFSVLSASSGPEAIGVIKKKRPDLVLMDVQLPGIDGLETTRMIVSDPEISDTKVVAFSALAMPADRKRAIKAGCIGYITKPVGARELIEAVESYLQD